jgi:hypothetical protein
MEELSCCVCRVWKDNTVQSALLFAGRPSSRVNVLSTRCNQQPCTLFLLDTDHLDLFISFFYHRLHDFPSHVLFQPFPDITANSPIKQTPSNMSRSRKQQQESCTLSRQRASASPPRRHHPQIPPDIPNLVLLSPFIASKRHRVIASSATSIIVHQAHPYSYPRYSLSEPGGEAGPRRAHSSDGLDTLTCCSGKLSGSSLTCENGDPFPAGKKDVTLRISSAAHPRQHDFEIGLRNKEGALQWT